jgi:hypothetical protein
MRGLQGSVNSWLKDCNRSEFLGVAEVQLQGAEASHRTTHKVAELARSAAVACADEKRDEFLSWSIVK